VARRRSSPAAVYLRPRAPLRGRPASRRRSRRFERQSGPRPCAGNRFFCRDGADRWKDGVDRDAARLHRHARPSRFDRSSARGAGRRRLRRGDGRAERRDRSDAALRVLRHAHDERPAGLRRSADPTAHAHSIDAAVERRGNSGWDRRKHRLGGARCSESGVRRYAGRCCGCGRHSFCGDSSSGARDDRRRGAGDRVHGRDRPGLDDSTRELTGCSPPDRAGVRDAGRGGRLASSLAGCAHRSGDAAGCAEVASRPGSESREVRGTPAPRTTIGTERDRLASGEDPAGVARVGRRQVATPGRSHGCRDRGSARVPPSSTPEAARHAPYHGFR
jgi:hypothetical protein